MWLQYNTDKYNAFLASTVNLNTIVLYLFSPTIMGIVIRVKIDLHIWSRWVSIIFLDFWRRMTPRLARLPAAACSNSWEFVNWRSYMIPVSRIQHHKQFYLIYDVIMN